MTQKQFEKLGKAKKRVVIAQDVINNIKSNKFIPLKSTYVDNLNLGNGSIKDQFDEIKNCDVCALGSCLLSVVKYKNSLNTETIRGYGAYDFINDNKIYDLLSSVFDSRQLALIEAAFENGENYYTNENDDRKYELTIEELRATKKFFRRFKSDKTRLIGIMSNIIKNNGEFIP